MADTQIDIDFYPCGGSGLGSDSNGPVPPPGPFAVAIYPVAQSNGTPVIPDTKLDGLGGPGFDANGATTETGGAPNPSAPNPDSVAQPGPGTVYPTTRNYPS